jgi:hypothetical protein
MNRKIAVVFAVFMGLLVLCCSGIFFYVKSVTSKITDLVIKDQKFVSNVLQSCTKNWDENEFSKFADPSFNTPEKRQETRKLFATLKQNLGPLVTLGEVTTDKKTFRAASDNTAQGFFVALKAKAKFQKGEGVFSVTVKNFKDKETIFAIGLDPVKPTSPPSEKR